MLPKLAIVLLALPLLAACASESAITARAFVVQGKYDPNACADIDGRITSTTKQIDELTGLMNKANESTAGPLIGAAVYWPTLAEARANLQLLREARAEKRCPDGAAKPAR